MIGLGQSVQMITSSEKCTGLLLDAEDEGYYTEQITSSSYASTRGLIGANEDTQESGDVQGEGEEEEVGEEEVVGEEKEEGRDTGKKSVSRRKKRTGSSTTQPKVELHPSLLLPVPTPPDSTDIPPDAHVAVFVQPSTPDNIGEYFDSGQSHEPRFLTPVVDSVLGQVVPLATFDKSMHSRTHLMVTGKPSMLDAIGRNPATQLVPSHMFARYRPGQLVTGMASPDVMCVGGRVHDVVDTYHYERRPDYKVFTTSSP